MSNIKNLSQNERQRILRCRKTLSEREFRLMVALRPDLKSVIAEGDSWFAYPPKSIIGAHSKSNIVNHLAAMKRFNLLQLASNGDEAVRIMSGKSKHRLAKLINGHHIDTLLFSGGGNDVVGMYDFDYLLRPAADVHSSGFMDYLHLDRINRRLGAVAAAYGDLIDYCDEYSLNKSIKIVSHTYDYPIPSPKGASFLGGLIKASGGKSWMYPYLKEKKIPKEFHQSIANYMIDRLADVLLTLHHKRQDRFKAVDTRGTVTASEWINEIHPNKKGFGKIAKKILPEI